MYDCEFNYYGLLELLETASQKKVIVEVLPVTWKILNNTLKKDGWRFDWKLEYKTPERRVFFLRTCTEDYRIQGLISATPMVEGKHIHLHLIEAAPHNLGSKKEYDGVLQCLVAYMCRASFEMRFEGFVAFDSKTVLISHYAKKLGAESVTPGNKRMFISSVNAKKLVNLYFKSH